MKGIQNYFLLLFQMLDETKSMRDNSRYFCYMKVKLFNACYHAAMGFYCTCNMFSYCQHWINQTNERSKPNH